MTIKAEIIADSVNPFGQRLITYVLTYNRYIHSEFLTHREFSRNSASSRAIPVNKMIESIRTNPAMPIEWGKNQKGMQAGELCDEKTVFLAKDNWLKARDEALDRAVRLNKLNIHKQLVNRITEPWAHMTTIVTATEWGNFFNLRCSKMAQPEFRELAYCMLQAYVDSTPVKKDWGDWHIPFGDKYLSEGISLENRIKIGVARCARVSYLNFEGNIDHEKDYQLHDSLINSGHYSPTEHVARAFHYDDVPESNLKGYWLQYRKLLPNENQKKFYAEALLRER